jgi:protein-S-isoprenylcysteine O-methyltransferase Ste14
MIHPSAWLLVLWTVWISLWLLASVWSARTVARETSGSRLAYTVLMAAGSALVFFPRERFRSAILAPARVAWIGVALTAIGLAFTVWARARIGRFWSGTVTLKQGHELIRTGPYAVTRHPIYTGLLLALVGTTLARASVAAVLGFALLTVGIVIKVRLEERLLLGHFGDAYREYRSRVPALIPRLW